MVRCHEMSHVMPTITAAEANRTALRYHGMLSADSAAPSRPVKTEVEATVDSIAFPCIPPTRSRLLDGLRAIDTSARRSEDRCGAVQMQGKVRPWRELQQVDVGAGEL